MSSRKQWFVVQDDSRSGPFSSSELRQLVSEGKVERKTKVWKEGLKQPVAASRIKGLFPSAQEPELSTSGDPKSMSSGKPIPQPSRAELRELVSSQKREIAETALSKSTSHTQFEEIKERYVTLTKEVADLRSAVPAITTAGEQLKIAEQNVSAANKNVEAAKKELLANAESLGEQGFECLNVLPDSANDYFHPRQDLESRIQKLLQELSDSDLPANATVMDKAKRKATQLKLKAQLQVEKLKIKSVNRQVGLALLEARDEELVRSDETINVIESIANIRGKIEDLKLRSLELTGSLTKATQAAGKAVGQPVPDLGSFTRIAKAQQNLIKTKDSGLSLIRDEVVDLLVSDSTLARAIGLNSKVQEFSKRTERLREATTTIEKKAAQGWKGLRGLSTVRKFTLAFGGLLLLFCLAWLILPNENKQLNLDTIVSAEPGKIIARQFPEENDGNTSNTKIATAFMDAEEHCKRNWLEGEKQDLLITQKLNRYLYTFKIGALIPGQGMFGNKMDYGDRFYVLDTEAAEIEFSSNGEAMVLIRYEGTEQVELKNGFEKSVARYTCVGAYDAGFRKRKNKTKQSYKNSIQDLAKQLVADQQFMRAFTKRLIPDFLKDGFGKKGGYQRNAWVSDNVPAMEDLMLSHCGCRIQNKRFLNVYSDLLSDVVEEIETMDVQDRADVLGENLP